MNGFLANVIWVLHILFILFFCLVPFFDIQKTPELHILHLFTGPLLFIHWIANSDECALTRIELMLRGGSIQKNESFFFNLVEPIYKPTGDAEVRKVIWALSIGLWLITVSKFIKNPCVFKDFFSRAMNGGRLPSSSLTVAPPVAVDGGSLNPAAGVVVVKKRVLRSYTSPTGQTAATIVSRSI